MNNKKLWVFLVSVSLVTVLTLTSIITGCDGTTPTQETKTLKIGGSMPLSGPVSAAGLAFSQGWELAVDKINEEGGLEIGDSTYMIELIVEDSKASPEGGTTAATKLCYQDGVKLLMGDIADYMIPPIYEVTSEAGVLFCVTQKLSSKDVPGSYGNPGSDMPLLIRMAPTNIPEIGMVAVEYLVENYPEVKTIGLMSPAFPEYEVLPEYYATLWAPLGLEVIPEQEMFPPDLIDFNPVVSRLLETNPDAIVGGSTLSQFPLIVKTAREMGFNGPIVFPAVCDPGYAGEVMPNLSDVITCGIPMDAPNLPDAINEVIELGQAKYGAKNFVEDSIFAYDQVMLLAQVLVKAQSVDPQTVQDTFETLTVPGSLQSVFGSAYVGGLESTGVNRVLVRPHPLSCLVNGVGEFLGLFPVEVK
jgi:branched-chain amino acid transport system substrate-binding protein